MNKQLIITLALSLCVSAPTFAKSTAQDGLSRIKENLDNAKANLDEYKKNLKIVDGNIQEVAKAKSKVEEEKKQVSSQVKENTTNQQRLQKSEVDINKLTKDEETKSALEDKKIQELQAMIAKIQENKTKREQNLQAYKVQQTQLSEEKKVWDQRGTSLKDQEKQVNDRLKALAGQEAEWRNKKRGYEGEVSRWQKEIDKQQKIYDQFKDLAEAKKQSWTSFGEFLQRQRPEKTFGQSSLRCGTWFSQASAFEESLAKELRSAFYFLGGLRAWGNATS